MQLSSFRTVAILSAVAALSTACPSDGDAPVIDSFSASAMSVPSGGTVQLSWSVTGADTVVISAVPGGELIDTTDASGTVTSAAIAAATTFTLVATNESGSVNRSLMVTVEDLNKDPAIDSFTATPMQSQSPGDDVVLTWETTNATSVDISDGTANVLMDGEGDGTTTVNPRQTTTYTLTAKGEGPDAMRSVTVTVPGPSVDSFTANPTTLVIGNTSDLSWMVSNADTVTVTSGDGTEVYDGSDLSGSVTVTPMVANPPGAVTYTLVAADADNRTAMGTVTITVNAPLGPAVNDFSAAPASITLGESSDLTWDVSDATEIEIQAGGQTATTSMALTGTYTVTPTTTTEYTLIARDGSGNTAMGMATVTVMAGPPAILAFDASPNPLALGTATTLAWNTVAADSVRVLVGATELDSSTMNMGTLSVTPTVAETTYTLEATNTLGTNSMDVTVYAHQAPVINTFTATPLGFSGSSTTAVITWDVSNVATLGLLADGQPVAGFPAVDVQPATTNDAGTYSTQVSMTTTFTLVAWSAAGQQTANVTVAEVLQKMEPNDTATAAIGLPGNGTAVTAMINPAGDEDWYSVTVPANGWLRAETSDGMGGCALDTRIDVYSSTNAIAANRIAENDDINFQITPPYNLCSRVTPFQDPDVGADPDLFEMPAGTYYIRVATSNFAPNDTGAYTLVLDVGAAACGNQLIETSINEQCDDGNTSVGDGCDAACMLEINPTVISGQGGSVTVTLGPGAFQLVQVDIAMDGQSVTATAADPGGTTCDNVDTAVGLVNSSFQLIDGKVDGGPTGAAGDCGSIYFPADTFAVDLTAGTYYVLVLNEGNTTGPVQVDVGIINPSCGDGAVTGTEACDDGNTMPGDGCDAQCMIEIPAPATLPTQTPYLFADAISVVGQHDLFEVTVTSTVYMVVETFVPDQATGCSGTNTDTVIALLDANMQEIAERDQGTQGNCSRFDWNDGFSVVAPGTYFIEVWDYLDNQVIPAYEIMIDSVDYNACGNGLLENGNNEICDDGNTAPGDGCDAACQPEGNVNAEIEPNEGVATANDFGLAGVGLVSISGAVNPAGDLDTFAFTVPAGQTLDFVGHTYLQPGNPASPCPAAAGVDTELVLYDSALTELDLNDDIDGTQNRCSMVTGTALAAGTYYVVVRHYSDDGSGNGFGTTGTYYLDLELQ